LVLFEVSGLRSQARTIFTNFGLFGLCHMPTAIHAFISTRQIYVEGESRNKQNFVPNTIVDPAERARLIISLQPTPQHGPGACRAL
jgi:hypothetical protein